MNFWKSAAILLSSIMPGARATRGGSAHRVVCQLPGRRCLSQLSHAQRQHSFSTPSQYTATHRRSERLGRCFASAPEPLTGALEEPPVVEEGLPSNGIHNGAPAVQPAVIEETIVVVSDTPVAVVDDAPLAVETAAPVDAGITASGNPSLANFLQQWQAYTSALNAHGFFRGEEFDIASTEVEQYGVVKRANLNLARERQDMLHSLPESKLIALISQKLPYEERKIVNAHERLAATYLDKSSLDTGRGGTANMQDLTRLIVGAYYSIRQPRRAEIVKQETPQLESTGFVDAVTALLPDVMRLIALPADPVAVAKAEEIAALKEKNSVTAPGTRVPYDRSSRSPRGQGQESFGDRQQIVPKPGDWACEVCGQHNFAHRVECFRCSSERPASAGPVREQTVQRLGDWTCPECNNVNFARRMECNRCSLARPAETLPKGGMPPPPSMPDSGLSRYSNRRTDSAPEGVKTGDWFCPSCNAHNFASRRECFQCQEDRPPQAAARPGLSDTDRRYTPRKTEVSDIRMGDWFCPECNQHNYASRNECFSCGLDKPADVPDRRSTNDFAGRVHPGRDDYARGASFNRGRGGGRGAGGRSFSRQGSGAGRGGAGRGGGGRNEDAFGSREEPRFQRRDVENSNDWFDGR